MHSMFESPFSFFKKISLSPKQIVHDPVENEAVALLGLNLVEKDDFHLSFLFSLCDDICHQLSWVEWISKDWKRGAISCCRWQQFQRHVPKLSPFGNDIQLLGQ